MEDKHHQQQTTSLFWMEKNHYGPANQQTIRPSTSPTFLSRIHQSIKSGIVIPKQFSDSFICKCTTVVKLIGPTGQISTVKVKILHNFMVILGRQWRNFVEYHELEDGDSILFTFIGSGTFQVRTFHLGFEHKQNIQLLTADMNDNVMRNENILSDVRADGLPTTTNNQLRTEIGTLRSPFRKDDKSLIAVNSNTDKSCANVNGNFDRGSIRTNKNCDKVSLRINGNREKCSLRISDNSDNILVKDNQESPEMINTSDTDHANNVKHDSLAVNGALIDSLAVNGVTSAEHKSKNKMHYLMLSDSDDSETEEDDTLSESKDKEVDREMDDHDNRTSSDIQSIVDKANEFTSEFPVIRKQLTPSYCNKMIFPKPFVREYMPSKDLTIKLLDPQGKEWKCSWLGQDRRLQKKHYTPCISKGWRDFTKANELKSHDIVIFELIDQKKIRFKVHFYRSS